MKSNVIIVLTICMASALCAMETENLKEKTGELFYRLNLEEVNINEIQQLIKDGVDLAAKNEDGDVPLLVAARKGHLDVCKFFLESGAPVEVKDAFDRTALFRAAEECHVELCRLLLNWKADVNTEDSYGYSPFYIAAREGHGNICSLLIEHGATVKNTVMPLSLAAQAGSVDICIMLLNNGADVDASDDVGQTPLYRAAKEGHLEVCRVLIEKGADCRAKDLYDQTPLLAAALKGHLEICSLLVENGADPLFSTSQAKSALKCAVRLDRRSITKLFLEHLYKSIYLLSADELKQARRHIKTQLLVFNRKPNPLPLLPKELQRIIIAHNENFLALWLFENAQGRKLPPEYTCTISKETLERLIARIKKGIGILQMIRRVSQDDALKSMCKIGALSVHLASAIGLLGQIQGTENNNNE